MAIILTIFFFFTLTGTVLSAVMLGSYMKEENQNKALDALLWTIGNVALTILFYFARF